MFWKLSFRQPSAIDALLEKEDCTLSEILDEDDVLQECKTHNKKLIDFLIRPEILEELVRMTCEEPAEDAEEKVKFKYPHLACELLTAEVYTIVEKLSSSESLLQLLWSFLDSSSPLDPLVGSFISKVLAMLLNKENINSVIMDFVKSREDFISQFLNHLGTSAMMDLLLQMVAAPENDKNRIELAEWLRDQGIVERLVDLVGNEAGSEQCVNASVALCEMIRLSRESYQMSNPAPLHTKLESEETMKRLLANMFSCEHPSDVVIVNGISVLLTALERRPNNPAISPAGPGGSYFNQPPEETQMESVIQPIGLESVLAVILPHLKDFHKLLSRTPEIGLMHTTVGILDPPLGNTRLQVVRLISAVLQCSSTSIATEVIRLQTFTNLLDLFFAYPWNNFLHMTVESCIMAALFTVPPPLSSTSSSSLLASGGTPAAASQEGGEASRSDEGEGANGDGQENSSVNVNHKSLRHHLLIDCQLVSRLLGGAEKNEEASSKPQGCRQGYMGHLVRIANSVARSGDSDEQLREILKSSLDEQTQQRWNNFINGSLADMNKKNETNLGGNRPMLADDSDEEFDPVGGIPTDSELDKAYQQFIDVKYTSPIMDDYGVEDELNPPEAPFEGSFTRLMDISLTVNADEEQTQAATIFDTACTERIQQFDDAESDDDDSSTWNDKEISFVSPVEQENRSPRSMSSGEDEELRREIQTGSGDDEDRAAVYTASTVSQITSKKDVEPDRMEIDNTFGGVLSWRSDIATAEDLSGVSAMDTGGDWTKEPDSPNSGDQQQSPRSNWADFNAAFGSKDNNSPQDMDLEPTSSGTHSHITVTYLSRTSQESPFSEGDDDLMDSPQRRAGYNYSPLSPDQDQASPLNIDSIEVSVGGADSSDEENNTSSDSDEERSGKYTLNTSTGSDGDLLLNSPGRDTDISQRENSEAKHDTTSPNTPSTSHDPTATPSSNGLEAATTLLSSGSSPEEQRKVVLNSNENNCTKNMDSHTSSNSGCNSEAGSSGEGKVNNKERLPDGEVGSEELQDNFKFLSKGMLSSEDGSKNKDGLIAEQSRLIEQKRAEAQEVCEQFEKVQKQDS